MKTSLVPGAGLFRRFSVCLAAVSLALPLCSAAVPAEGPFSADRASLERRDPAPEWFRDAKFGIYFHWGVYSVPAFGNEWYPRSMHLLGSAENRHHRETYGDPLESGYHDLIPGFTAKHFDAAEWAELFARAGARFAGPVAEHHDNFSLWDSRVNPWNSVAMGPKRDITGELEKAVRARGMRFLTTFHHDRPGIWTRENGRVDGHYEGVKTNYPGLLEKPELKQFYGDLSRDDFLKLWLDKLVEVIDRYRPDLIWHDSWMDEIPEPVANRYLAHYFNRAAEWGTEVVVTTKQLDLPRSIAVEDFEKGRTERLTPYAWLTDDTISYGSWCHTRDLGIKPADEVIDTLVDIVSKNGQLLLNISPTADGVIPENQRAVLLEIGDFLRVNGEAVYSTRPWLSYGEGPTRMGRGGHFLGTVRYGARDVRYTRSKDGATVYATALGWPEGPLTLSHVRAEGRGRVDLLGHAQPVEWRVNEQGQLVILPPALAENERPGKHAFSFRLSGFGLSLHPAALFDDPEATLEAGRALLDGPGIGLEEKHGGRKNIGFWDHPAASAHWLARLSGPGKTRVALEYASLFPVSVRLRLAGGGFVDARLPATGAWDRPAVAELGTLEIPAEGVHHLSLEAAEPSAWRALNVWSLRAVPAP